MEFKYTQLPESESPIMLIDTHIGMDETDGEGIMGSQFVRELMFLDTQNKKSIQVWICTPGGSCMDGEQIYNAILKSKTPVDTYNVGTAASIGGPIFLAGRNRYMGSWAKLMMHPASGGDKKSLDAYNESVAKMLSSRSFLSEDQVKKLMARTSWIMADEAKDMGLCTEVEYSEKFNSIKNADLSDVKAYSKIINKIIHDKKPSMKKVANKLGVDASVIKDEALEDAIMAKLDSMAVENKSKFDKFVDELAEAKKAKDEAVAKYDALNKDYIETKAIADKAKADQAKADADSATAAQNKLNEDTDKMLKDAVDAGKIENKDTVIADWKSQAVVNKESFDKIKNMIDSLPVNKARPTKVINKFTDTDNKVVPYSFAAQMSNIAIKNKQI